eukprot:scaffold27344_cov60-Phaeocystis_antarctica.AAC.2
MQDLEQLAALHNAVMKMPDEEGLKFLSAAPGQFKHRFDGSIRSMLCGSIRTCSEQVRSMFSDEAEVEAMDDWSVNTVFTWLQGQHFLGDAKQTFATSAKRKEVDGSMLKLLDDRSLEELGIASGILRLKLMIHVIRVNALAQQIQKEDRALKAKTLAQQTEKAQHMEKLCEKFNPQGVTQKESRALKVKRLSLQVQEKQQTEKAQQIEKMKRLSEFMGVTTQSIH